MTQTSLTIDAATSAVLIMDFQQRIVNNVASEPDAVVRNAARALDGARAAGIPVIYVVHRGGPFAEYVPDVELHEGVAPAEGERIITKRVCDISVSCSKIAGCQRLRRSCKDQGAPSP